MTLRLARKIKADWMRIHVVILAWCAAEWDRQHPPDDRPPKPAPSQYRGKHPHDPTKTMQALRRLPPKERDEWMLQAAEVRGALDIAEHGTPDAGGNLFETLTRALAAVKMDIIESSTGEVRWSN